MDAFLEFGTLKYVHRTIDKNSGFQWAIALGLEKAGSVIMHFLEVMDIMGIPALINNGPTYVSKNENFRLLQYKAYYSYTK